MENKVLQIVEPGVAIWADSDVPVVRDNEVLIRVAGIATCPHWDMRIFSGTPMFESRPLVFPYTPGEPGHEACGTIVKKGTGVTNLTVGDDIVVWRDPGNRRQGCYARYVAVEAEHVLMVPKGMPAANLAPLELAMCVQVSFDQLNDVSAVQGKRFLIGGLGPAGLIAVQMAKAYGAKSVTCTDPIESRRNLAVDLGADAAIPPNGLPDSHHDSPYDTALDTTGLTVAIDQLVKCTRETVAIFGVIREPVGFGPERWWGGFKLMGYGEHNRDAATRALDRVIDGSVDLSKLITTTLPFSRYAEGVAMLKNKEAIKVLFNPWSD